MQIQGSSVSPRFLPSRSVNSGETKAFADMLARGLERARDLHAEADSRVMQMTAGQTDNLHEVMASLERASLALELTVAIRDKLVESYQEIMRMQV